MKISKIMTVHITVCKNSVVEYRIKNETVFQIHQTQLLCVADKLPLVVSTMVLPLSQTNQTEIDTQ